MDFIEQYPQPIDNEIEATKIVVNALFKVYDMPIIASYLATEVARETNATPTDIDAVMAAMLEASSPLIRKAGDGVISFGTSGLWLIEDGFNYNDDEINGIEVVHASLAKSGFFKLLETKCAERAPREIERKYLVNIPEDLDLDLCDSTWIRQGYAAVGSDGAEARLRQRNNVYTVTFKSGGDMVRTESEVGLLEEQFTKLWPATAGRRLEKRRYTIPYSYGNDRRVIIELDLYRGDMDELAVAEVEFPNRLAAETFVAPSWFAAEVTEDKAYKNQRLALNGIPASFYESRTD